MAIDTQTLKSLGLFSELDSEELDRTAKLIHPMRVMEGEVLALRREPAQMFYMIMKGNFMVSFKEGKAFTLHQRGDIMGWSTIVTPFRYTGTIVALTDGEVLAINGDEFKVFIQGDSSVGEKIMNRINPIIAERVPYFSREAREARKELLEA